MILTLGISGDKTVKLYFVHNIRGLYVYDVPIDVQVPSIKSP